MSYPCDELNTCPYNAKYGMDCYYYCGLGADESAPYTEDEEE